MRKLLDTSSVAQSLDSGDRLKGSLRFPEEISSRCLELMQQKE
jgi:hypothetical protein